MLEIFSFLFGGTLSGLGSLISNLSQTLFYSTGLAGSIFGGVCLFIVLGAISLFLRNFGVVVVGVPLIILAYIFLRNVVPVLIVLWVVFMIIQTRRGKVI